MGSVAKSLRDELVSKLSNDSFCPGVDLNAATREDFDAIIQNTTTFLEDLGNFSLAKVDDTQEAVQTAQDTTEAVRRTSENITPSDWQSLIFIVPFSVFAVVFLVGVALAWYERDVKWLIFLLRWIVLPLFIILVVICFILAGAIAITASANAGKTIRWVVIVLEFVSCLLIIHRCHRFLCRWRVSQSRGDN